MADWLADIFRAATAPAPVSYGGGFAQPPPFSFPQFGGGLAAPSSSITSLRQMRAPAYGEPIVPMSLRLHGKPRQTPGAAKTTASGYQPVGQAQVGPGMSANVMKWLPLVEKYASQQGVPVELALAIIHNESGGNEKATSAYNPGSGTAKGLFQTLSMHYKAGEDPYDPETNVRVAMRLLGDSYKRYGGDPYKVMAAHFGGPGAIDAQGNIRRDWRDVNISMGDYLDKKFGPTFNAYAGGLRKGAASAPATAWRDAYKNGTLTPDQFQSGLPWDVAVSACGPAAAVAFARATGRNPTLPEAVELAKQYGWSSSAGTAGAQSQVALLNQMGVQSRLEAGVDWAKVARTVQSGQPVIIDTPRHYLVVEGFDPQTGMFDFGNSGRVLKNSGGKNWFTPQQVDGLGLGGFRSSIYMAAPQQALARMGGASPIEGWTGGRAFTVTGEFGSKDPEYPQGSGHVGMDIGTPSNTPLTSAINGTVVHAGGDFNRGGYGNAVVVKTDDGHLVVLGHLGQVGVQVGQRVAPGAALGLSGSTGKSTGPHLHLEVRDPSGRFIDPRAYFGGRR